MRRFRHIWRRRRAALGLIAAATAITVTAPLAAAAPDAEQGTSAERFEANKKKVRPGAKVKVRGQFAAQPATTSSPIAPAPAPTAPGSVRIEFKPAGKDNYAFADRAKTDKQGRYTHTLKVRRSGHFRAVAPDGRISEPERVRVKSRVKAKLANDDVNLGDKLKVKGSVQPAISRRKVVVKVGGDTISTKTNKRGKFQARWKADDTGTKKVTVKAKGDKIAAGSKDKAGKATVYRPAAASYYGPGFYGGRTACGQTLSPGMMGVAHKSMPCGTKLKLRYGNRTVKVEVIDRGPYAGDREFDLTEATKNKLGFPSTGTVWTNK
jgi:rare lipoprotein A